MKPVLLAATLLAAACLPRATAQTPMVPTAPYGQPAVLTHAQAQAQTKTQMAQAQVQYIGLLERGFDSLSSLVTANPYHLTSEDVVAGFGDTFNAQTQQQGTLMLSTIIKANRILGRTDKWLAQDWVQQWITTYRLDPATGDPLPGS